MMQSGVIYQYRPAQKRSRHKSWTRKLGLGIIVLALGGLTGPLTPTLRLETNYALKHAQLTIQQINKLTKDKPLPKAAPVIFNPLVTANGTPIVPINSEFSLIVPKVGINAAVIPAVNPTKPGEYMEALEKGVAHSSLSYFPDEDGTVYLFSHSTNYDWFVNDLNAVFYLLKNLETGDPIVVIYNSRRYTYRLTDKQVVPSTSVSYLVPQVGRKRLILQTCWPPGSTEERLLIFADLVEEYGTQI